MPHSYNKIWIHAIWSTKYRDQLIMPKIEFQVYQYMREQFIESGCPVRIISGMPDHVHCLFLLNPQKSIAEIIKQIKGSTSHFINEQNLIEGKFSWQTGYAAYSVSESAVEKVFEYIKNQKSHHAKMTFLQEYNDFLKLYGFENG
ncbi:MAG TPA: IS200/IS605 family transposase [Bacteroidales bacterium]|nr:IS200/IS605 family transposase [Bacteroidales bacterium]HNZ43055.1 IS200/IS605 family transposase [Bacteroidales bacterium]HOH83061.1 IS200/IS605 family transposase [Bacteroidales bacterium]HPB24388.1 IS200/IS605 family transposase [Bacteroidales bacterium]HPI31270.1 IS200/IS605 family transposase [Bacteroidales bacterium]